LSGDAKIVLYKIIFVSAQYLCLYAGRNDAVFDHHEVIDNK